MGCAICGQIKTGNELIVLSYSAYVQILSILKIADAEIQNKTKDQNDLPIHICKECLQGDYEYSNI
ncbi:MAG: hypothetical protein KKE91_00545 [Candidatus Omnitrophica bacterium]|nr:hypothetical protein [Candidatus Omnitrophota bacterium]